MRARWMIVAAVAASLTASAALAADEAPAPAPAPTATDSGKEADTRLGEKEWKERINLVARKPARHDIAWIDSRDRVSWRTFSTWQGVRDEHPMIARKTQGFHEPSPYVRRAERVERISRGPLRGPVPSE